jgi:hypothetical protein
MDHSIWNPWTIPSGIHGIHGPFQPESMDYSMWIPDGVALDSTWNSDGIVITASTGN